MAKFCNSCIYWEMVIPRKDITGKDFGICKSLGVKMDVAMDSDVKINEDGTLWTAEFFGCIYWSDNDGSIVGFDKLTIQKT